MGQTLTYLRAKMPHVRDRGEKKNKEINFSCVIKFSLRMYLHFNCHFHEYIVNVPFEEIVHSNSE